MPPMNKKAIDYLRFSSDDQSHHSIERQELINSTWRKNNNVFLIDSFKDEGYSAKTFDRPDVKELFSFIKKNYRDIDYLVVSELTRFSRDAGEALSLIKEIQQKYNIRIVSAGRNQVYDINDSNSYFMMGIEFLLGTTENIKRASDINGGIYTAKAIKGKWIQGGKAPYGFKKEGTGNDRKLVIHEEQATVIRYIYDAYLKDQPAYIILREVRKMGFTRKGSSPIQEILTNPIFIGYQYVKAWNDKPAGLFPIKDLPSMIDPDTWHRVQNNISGPKYKKTVIDELPLRGVLKCECGQPVTGAPSTGKSGKKFLYYKCKNSHHLNLGAIKAHKQLQDLLAGLSLPDHMIELLHEEMGRQMIENQQESRKALKVAKKDMERIEADILVIEKKFIQENTINAETYQRWHKQLTTERVEVASRIEKFSKSEESAWWLAGQELEKLGNLQYLYNSISTTDKQELLRQVFDSSLYYSNGTYRTPWIMDTFSHNLLRLKEQGLLTVDGYNYHLEESPVMWTPAAHNRTLQGLLTFLHTLKVA